MILKYHIRFYKPDNLFSVFTNMNISWETYSQMLSVKIPVNVTLGKYEHGFELPTQKDVYKAIRKQIAKILKTEPGIEGILKVSYVPGREDKFGDNIDRFGDYREPSTSELKKIEKIKEKYRKKTEYDMNFSEYIKL